MENGFRSTEFLSFRSISAYPILLKSSSNGICHLSKEDLLANYKLPVNKEVKKKLKLPAENGERWQVFGSLAGTQPQEEVGPPGAHPVFSALCLLLIEQQPPLLSLGRVQMQRQVPISQLSVSVVCRDVSLGQGYLTNHKAFEEGEMVLPVFPVPHLACGPEFPGSRSHSCLSVLRGRTPGFRCLRVFGAPW